MPYTNIEKNIRKLLCQIPSGVGLVAAVKTRTLGEVKAAVESGISVIGENYVQEALDLKGHLPLDVKIHFIGHLQKNKVKKAVEVFDLIETVDSLDLALEIDKRSRNISKVMPVFIEVNSGRESQKHGVFPEKTEDLIRKITKLSNVRIKGIMTMGFFSDDIEKLRPLFRDTKMLFDSIASMDIPGAEMLWLSMGMSDSYSVAIEEGANIVRIGTGIFGERKQKKD